MAPLTRLPHNKPLPARWTLKHGAYYYIVPPGMEQAWDGKRWFRLGTSLSEAHQAYAERIKVKPKLMTIGELLDRYLVDVAPKKSASTYAGNVRQIARLRAVFGEMALSDIEPMHVYQYADRRASKAEGKSGKTAAKREIEVLSHAFTMAVSWGVLRAHPFKGEVRIADEAPRTRYVEDWEVVEALSLPIFRKKGGVSMVQAYLRLKLLTGLRQRDLLLLTASNLREDGIHVTPSKTAKSTGKRIIYEWTPELRQAIDDAKAVRPALSPYLFCTTKGECFVTSDGRANNWQNIWQRFMGRVIAETNVKERFTEHDLRAKVGSDADSLERAKQLLTHSDSRLTDRVYRRKPERIKPVR